MGLVILVDGKRRKVKRKVEEKEEKGGKGGREEARREEEEDARLGESLRWAQRIRKGQKAVDILNHCSWLNAIENDKRLLSY